MEFTTCTRSPTARIDGETELDLCGNFIAIGDRHFTHVIAKSADFQMTGILFRDRLTHPGADTLMACLSCQ